MNETQFLALAPNVVCLVLSLVMFFQTFNKAPSEHKGSILATFASITSLALILGMERFIEDPATFAAFVAVEYAASVALLVSILSFSLSYTGLANLVNRRLITLILIAGAFFVAANATNYVHGLFYTSFEIIEKNGLHMLQPEYGPIFFVWLAYVLGILAFVMGWLLKSAGGMIGPKRTGTVLIVVGIGFYTVMGVLNAIIPRDPRVDMLTIGLVGASLTVYAANSRSDIIIQHGMTMDEALRDAEDGVIIEDPDHRIMYMNDTARELAIAGRSPFPAVIPTDSSEDVHLTTKEGEREFNVKRSLVERNGVSVGTVTVMRDVTNRKTVERQLSLANHRLDTMGRALRHDVMNELTVLNGHLELLSGTEMTDKQQERLTKALNAAKRIDDLIEKTRMDHILDPVKPKWQVLDQTIRDGIRNSDLQGVSLQMSVCDCQVLADTMLPTVFGNLMDNSLRHGDRVKEIKVNVERSGQRTLIVWEDDGMGVPEDEKKRIFEKGIGKHTGMGLFLVREILNITGMDIHEDGVPGKGARFVITVPASSIRKAEK